MNTMLTKALSAATLLFASISLTACGPDEAPPASVGLANPASEYCISLGGTSEPVTDPTEAGSKRICVLPNGDRIEEWQLFRRDHKDLNTSEAPPISQDD